MWPTSFLGLLLASYGWDGKGCVFSRLPVRQLNANVASDSWKGERLPQRRHFSAELLPLIKAGSSMPMEERERGREGQLSPFGHNLAKADN